MRSEREKRYPHHDQWLKRGVVINNQSIQVTPKVQRLGIKNLVELSTSLASRLEFEISRKRYTTDEAYMRHLTSKMTDMVISKRKERWILKLTIIQELCLSLRLIFHPTSKFLPSSMMGRHILMIIF